MNSENGINLESSLLGFCMLNDFSCYKEHGILMRNDEDFLKRRNQVILISGGGAGHEPGPAFGFLGKGMLSSGVSGDIFTSPSVMSCLASILIINDPNREILFIINNYTGDRLNFGLAIEMAKNIHNYQHIKLLIVDDDCSIDNPSQSTGRRGLAGISLINKIAGAMNEKGSRLNEIHDFCLRLLEKRWIRTIGYSFHHDKSSSILSDIEIGYGIHGEAGSIKIEKEKSFKPIIGIMKEKLRLNDVKSDAVILFNNLGGASEFIFNHFVKEFTEVIEGLSSLRVVRIYAGKFLTSLSKEALSVTLLEVHDLKLIEYLDLPVNVPCSYLFQPFTLQKLHLKVFPMPQGIKFITNDNNKVTANILTSICEAVLDIKEYLNELDSEFGDGDTGTTLSRGAEALLKELQSHRLNVCDPHEMLLQISTILMSSMGGTSGAIFSIYFQYASKAFVSFKKHSIECWMESLLLGIDGIMKHGKSRVGDRTLLDSLYAGLLEMKSSLESSKDLKILSKVFAMGCEKGTNSTRDMPPRSGRAAYTQGNTQNGKDFKGKYPDPGAFDVQIISKTISDTFSL
ncbi:CLUMA_CG011090, isoform A [Clunio marinus]|uniref:Triokinase/FMN cyclase n=1 Tax=Clunio marinus TaxID=568069 RepID=A0A1J1IFD4_9DIPT|nr:CLUMA_CG011090, isoform A [Clunio marinus]